MYVEDIILNKERDIQKQLKQRIMSSHWTTKLLQQKENEDVINKHYLVQIIDSIEKKQIIFVCLKYYSQ